MRRVRWHSHSQRNPRPATPGATLWLTRSAMGRILGLRSTSVLLLLFLMFLETAAAPSPESVYRQAQATQDRGEVAKSAIIALQAMKRFGDRDDHWTWRI